MDINIDDILKNLRDIIGVQAQEIAVLRATVAALETKQAEVPTEN